MRFCNLIKNGKKYGKKKKKSSNAKKKLLCHDKMFVCKFPFSCLYGEKTRGILVEPNL